MGTDVRLTQGILETLWKASGIDVLLTQGILETLWKASGIDVRLTQGILEVLFVSDVSVVSLSAYVELTVSGNVVKNAIGLKPLAVSAQWITGAGTFTYQWDFELPVGSSTTSAINRTFSAGSGLLDRSIMSAFVSNDAGSSVGSSIAIYVRHAGIPNPFDGKFQESNQSKRRVWPL